MGTIGQIRTTSFGKRGLTAIALGGPRVFFSVGVCGVSFAAIGRGGAAGGLPRLAAPAPFGGLKLASLSAFTCVVGLLAANAQMADMELRSRFELETA